MPVTAIYGLPYPSLSDPPHGPAQLQALAQEVEAELSRVDAAAAGVAADVTTLEADTLGAPLAELRQTTAQALAHNVYTSVAFNAENVDTAGGHDNATNNSRYTCQRAGYYLLSGGVSFDVSATGQRSCRWALNGTAVNGSTSSGGAAPAVALSLVARPRIIQLAVNDFVELQAWQNTGALLNTFVTAENQSSLVVRYLRPV